MTGAQQQREKPWEQRDKHGDADECEDLHLSTQIVPELVTLRLSKLAQLKLTPALCA